MGVIFEQFHSIKYENEAEVSHKFVIPLLTEHLGFSLEDIKPEREFPAKPIFFGHKNYGSKGYPEYQRPDFIICINDISNPKFVLESKAPSEELENHLSQMQSYASGVGVDLLVITNGISLKIYYGHTPIFEAKTIEDLDLNFGEVKRILCKEVQARDSPLEIIKAIDIGKALGKSSPQLIEEERRKLRLKLSDFQEYLKNIKEEFQDWQIPREFQALSLKIEQYPPDRLHRFKIYQMSKISLGEEKSYTLAEIEQKFNTPVKIFIGPSGIGKTTLLKYVAYLKASDCLSLHNVEIPIYIQLKYFSHSLNLENLIIQSLEKRGFNTSQTLQKLLQKNTFIFLLDAFDEVQEQYLEDAKREIELFAGMRTHKIIITSRETRIKDLPSISSQRFLVNPLEQSEIESLLEQYLGNERFKFLSEIKRKGLVDEAKNTLLLTLMILIYKEEEILPISRTKIVGKVVGKIKEWEESKGKRLTNGLQWRFKERILSEIAYKIVENHENLTLSKKQIDSVLKPLIETLEENREISKGIDKNWIIDDLALTGIVSFNDDVFSFWHRAFLNYFASKALADKYLESPKILEEIRNKIVWEPIIVGSAEHLDDSTKFIETLRDTNLFLASACLGEAKKISEHTIKDIVSQLSIKCSSPINEIRLRAIWFLKRINPTYTIEVFFDFLDNNPYPDIRKIAIEEVAKEKSSRAKMAVYKLIDWDEKGGIFLGSTQGSIAKALSNFDIDDQLKIIKIWRTKPDIFTSEDCEEAIRNIIRAGRLTERIKQELVDFYLQKEENDKFKFHKEWGLADILIEIGDENIVPKLIKSFEERGLDGLYPRTVDILSSYKSEKVIEQLSSKATDQKISNKIREGCSAALTKSKGVVPLSTFVKLIADKNPHIRRNAVEGLDRFPTSDVKELLFKNVNDENRGVQYEAIRVLGNKGLIVELVNKDKFPKRFYNISVPVLLEQTRKYKLREMLPILDLLKDKVRNDDRNQIDIAHTYSIIGEKEKAKEIIESFFHENELVVSEYGLADLAEISPIFDPPYSLRIIKEVLKSIDKLSDKSSFWEDECIEALERIGNRESLEMLKELATKYAAQKETILIERSLRAINSLAKNEDEEWYINFIKTNLLENADLRRAIEGLGIIGSEKSIPVIREIAALHKTEEYTIATCFLSIENIYRNSGMLVEITEKDVLK